MKHTVLFLALLGILVAPAGAATPGAGVPALSLQRLSVAIGADYCAYQPQPVLGLSKGGEFQVNTVAAYNLGRWSSLAGSMAYGVDSKEKFYRVGVRIHLLARGAKP